MSSATAGKGVRLQRVRETVRDLLTESDGYRNLDASTRRDLARGLVEICSTALELDEAEDRAEARDLSSRPPFARAQSAGTEFSGVAADRVARTTQQILTAVSFPRFVTELINGVFKALVDSNQQQLTAYVDLIRNVAASTGGFAEANVGLDGARRWLVERFPESFSVDGEADPFAEPGQPPDPEEPEESETRLRLRSGASMPPAAALRAALGLASNESLSSGDPESLVPLARAALARNRQQMLSTMVMLGLQRIVIESGRLSASMRFHIDTRSAAEDDRASQFDARHTSTVAGSFGYGPWGASATMTNTIGYVSTQKTQTTEEMNTDLDLNSAVELVFKTDYLPLDRLAGRDQVDRIKVNTLNPEAEIKAATDARSAREKRISETDAKRRDSLDKAIGARPEPPKSPKPGEDGSKEAADKARLDAEKEKAKKKKPEDRTTGAPAGQPAVTGGAPGAGTGSAGAGGSPSAGAGSAGAGGAPGAGAGSAGAGGAPGAGAGSGGAGGAAGARAGPARTRARSLSLSGDLDQVRKPGRVPDVVYIPTPEEGVGEMLALAGVRSDDLLYDLGCGDGRIVITAAQRYGCRAVGFDIDPQRLAESRENVSRSGLAHRVRIEERDIFDVDLSEADVVTLYLLPQLNVRLIPQISRMKPGARIVSHDFDMAGVIPDRVMQVYLSGKGIYKSFYLWTTPLKERVMRVPHEWSNSRGIYDVAR